MKRVYVDPLTGDQYGLYEHLSWVIQQNVLRRPAFLLLWTVGTLLWWHFGGLFGVADPDLLKWNLGASWLAVTIEQIVGTGFLGQARRDAVVIRELRRRVERLEQTESDELAALEDIRGDLAEERE